MSYTLFAERVNAIVARMKGQAVAVRPMRQTEGYAGRNYVTAVAIVYNEAPYILEWIRFHHMLGVEHFFIYDNDSDDGLSEVLGSLVDKNIVTIVPWLRSSLPKNTRNPQSAAYAHALSNFGASSRWMAFLDIDEFMYPLDEETLPDLLRQYEDVKSLSAYWYTFGFSGNETKPDQPVFAAYTKRLSAPPPPDLIRFLKVKSIVQPKYVRASYEAHMFILDRGIRESWNEERASIIGSYKQPELFAGNRIRVNHYYTKSRQEFLDRRVHRGRDVANNPLNALPGHVVEALDKAAIEDRDILRFLPRFLEYRFA